MKLILPEDVKRIQCELLQDIANFCEQEGITYFLAYGTLIGAIRHNGFIPWDDDIDIAMPRTDYDKFVKTYNQRNSDKRVIDRSVNSDYNVPFAKVYDARTWLDEYKYSHQDYGIYIDIFPIDGYGNKCQMLKARLLDKLLHAKRANFKKRSLLKNLSNMLAKLFLLPFSINDLLKYADANARKFAFGSTERAGNFLETYGTCEVGDTEWFAKTVFHEFEGKQFRIPVGYDQWLRNIYGDYMQLPPVEEQVAHHIYNVYWKDSQELQI